LKDKGWHQIAMTSQLSGPTNLYVDAENVNSILVSGSEQAPPGIDLLIGALMIGPPVSGNSLPVGLPTYSFNGTISNVQFYNTAFTQNDLSDLYSKGMGGAPILLQNLVGWWPLNGDANDYSGNGNNGVPNNVSYVAQYGK
jgi:hypothetical protein